MNEVPSSSAILNDILALVAAKMKLDPGSLSADTDLFALGLDSITLMGLVAHWRAAGHRVDFASLAKAPRAGEWVRYLAAPVPAANAADAQGLWTSTPGRQDDPVPLAPMQYAYWLGRDPKQPLGGVAAHLYTEFDRAGAPALDPDRLGRALQRLVERHASLRLKVTADGQQTCLPAEQAGSLRVMDLRNTAAADIQQQLDTTRQQYSSRMLDIEAGEVFAIALSLLPDGCRLHLDVDMIAADAVSYRTLLRELALLYENLDVTLPALPVSYRDCRIAAERRWPAVKRGAGQWWQNRLYTLPEGPQLPLKPVPEPSSAAKPRTTRRHFHFDAGLRNTLYAQCRQHGLTPAAVLATVMAETLAGWSSEPRFLINVPLFLRPMDGPDVSGVVGDFSSSVMLDADLSRIENFTERARQIQSRLHEDAAHADYNGVQVLRDLGRMKGRQVTAPVVFTSALNLGELFDPAVRRVFGDPVWIISQGPQVLLDTQITELDGGLLLNWDCREDAFVDGVLDAMFAFFHQSVIALATVPQTWSRCLADSLPADRTRAQAPAPIFCTPDLPPAPPQTPIEKAIAAVWADVLGGRGDNINQNLFAAGGDSVLANTLVARLREIFGVQVIDMQRLFNAPTIAGLAEAIGNAGLEQMTRIAGIYCEILELDDAALMAEFAEASAP